MSTCVSIPRKPKFYVAIAHASSKLTALACYQKLGIMYPNTSYEQYTIQYLILI